MLYIKKCAYGKEISMPTTLLSSIDDKSLIVASFKMSRYIYNAIGVEKMKLW